MQAKTSKEVTDRQRDCHFLTTALLEQGPRISGQLLEQVRPHLLEGDVEPNAEPMQVAQARALDANMRDTVADDEAMFYANARLDELRLERTEAARRVSQAVILLRRIVMGQYKVPRLNHLGIGTRTEKSPSLLLRQAHRATAAFSGQQLEDLLGEPFLEGQAPPQAAAEELGARAEVLRAVLDEIDQVVRQRDEAYVAKERHLAKHEQLFVYVARSFEAHCRLAGEAELAERVRRSARRRRTEEPEVISEGETTEPPTESAEEKTSP